MSNLLEVKKQVYEALKSGNLSRSEELSLGAMGEDISDSDWDEFLRITKFWQNRDGYFSQNEALNSGELLFTEWEKFVDFCVENRIRNKKAVFAVKSWVFKVIVELLIESHRLSPVKDKQKLVLLGEAFYEIGLVEKAVETLEYVLSEFRNDEEPRVYILLGDIYAEMEDHDMAAVMYNEIFFRFPQLVNLEEVDYPAVHKLAQMAKEDGFQDNEVLEWIPVYGYLYNGLPTRRGLEYPEFMSLQAKIKEYEKSLQLDKKVLNIIIPRLINYYLWVFDYYLYQVKALNVARKVVQRIGELIDSLSASDEAKERIRDCADTVLKKALTVNWVSARNEQEVM